PIPARPANLPGRIAAQRSALRSQQLQRQHHHRRRIRAALRLSGSAMAAEGFQRRGREQELPGEGPCQAGAWQRAEVRTGNILYRKIREHGLHHWHGGLAMPWKETCAMDERMRLVVLVKDGTSIAEASRQCGVSRVTAHEWLKRYELEGVEGLRNRSSAP